MTRISLTISLYKTRSHFGRPHLLSPEELRTLVKAGLDLNTLRRRKLGVPKNIGYVSNEMTVSNSVNLTREVTATAIPAGTAQVLTEGTEVYITQELGGSFTIHAGGLLFRIEGKDGDALGRESTNEIDSSEETDSTLEDDSIWEKLRCCFDPEIPVNIVDLGLIYDLKKQALPSGKFKVFVKMTLTAPGCGMGDVIANDARQQILTISSVDDALVEIVWDPPWHQSMITEQGRVALGLN